MSVVLETAPSVPVRTTASAVARTGRGALAIVANIGLHLLVVAAVAAFVGLGVLPRLGLYRPVTVLSGSMRPTFSPGDLIIVRPEPLRDVRVGQVITYAVPTGAHQVETHRVIRILHRGDEPVIQTEGDANTWKDPWTAQLHGTTAWRLSYVVPYGGYAISALRSPMLRKAAVFGTPAVVALLLLGEIWGIGRRPRVSDARP